MDIAMISNRTPQRTFFKLLRHLLRVLLPLLNIILVIQPATKLVQSQIIDVSFNKEICDPVEFYQPYVKVSKTRKGPIVKGLYETGKIMVNEYSGLLCINGPAFIYVDMGAEPQVFSHGCFAFNRRVMNEYQSGVLSPLDSNTKVYGNKVYGVFLLADPMDLRRTQFNWFRNSEFGYFPGDDVIVDGSAFAIIANDAGKSGTEVFQDPPGPNSYCFHIDKLNVHGKVTASIQAGEIPKFCYQRGEEDPPDDFYEVFQKNLTASEYMWVECSDQEPGGTSTEIDNSVPGPMPDFRIIDPALLRPQGSLGKPFKGKLVVKPSSSIPFYSRPFPPGYFFKGEPGYENPITEPPDPVDYGSGESTTLAPLKNVKTELIICEELPEVPSSCEDEPDPDQACALLEHVLTIEEVKWGDEKNNLVAASWRKEVMDLVVKIYQQVCPQVSKGLAPAVTKIVEYFISKVAMSPSTVTGTAATLVVPGEIKFKSLNDPKRPEWDQHLIPDLKRCWAGAMKMPFYRTRDLANEKKKQDLEQKLEEFTRTPNSTINIHELEDLMRDVHIQFPYYIWLPPPESWNNKTQIQVRDHIEAAEIDYNLDWAIDTFWKVFSTVLGYCNKHYTIRNGNTFKQLYSYFTEDIMDLVVEQWVQDAPNDGKVYVFGNFEKAYDQLFGEFVNGISSRYIDACNDGSYWWADVPDYRPVRPVYLKEGAVGAGGSNRPVNFFVEHPLFPPSTAER